MSTLLQPSTRSYLSSSSTSAPASARSFGDENAAPLHTHTHASGAALSSSNNGILGVKDNGNVSKLGMGRTSVTSSLSGLPSSRGALGDITNRIVSRPTSSNGMSMSIADKPQVIVSDDEHMAKKARLPARPLSSAAPNGSTGTTMGNSNGNGNGNGNGVTSLGGATRTSSSIPLLGATSSLATSRPLTSSGPQPPTSRLTARSTSLLGEPSLSSSGISSMNGMMEEKKTMLSTIPSSLGFGATERASIHSNDDDTDGLGDALNDLSIASVDEETANDAQEASEYIQEIMDHFRKVEPKKAPSPTYMSRQQDINARMREILVDWLVEVHFKFKLQLETLYLTIHIIDRFLERRAVSRNKLQLVGCTAMLLASKYEETYPPEVKDFVFISDQAYQRDQILAMETIILNSLSFEITTPSALRFGERFMKVARASPQVRLLTLYLMECSLLQYKFLRHLPSLIAASSLCIALRTCNGRDGNWSSTLQSQTRYSEADMAVCIADLLSVVQEETPKCRAIRKKYSSPKLGQVSKYRIV